MQICVPFLQREIVELELAKEHLENEVNQLARRNSKAKYMMTWHATMPTAEKHDESHG